ncbi:MAG: hypothetical protein LLF94_09230 [Chlamydiales bacterium]|nr:hypothetical protein [Chlamydiales bacterium]
MMTATLSRIRLVSNAAEQLIGPMLVFGISYAHHIYFADHFVSSFFAAFSVVSLLLVMAVDKTGILLALATQLVFLGWVAYAQPISFMEQLLFSTSITLAIVATYINQHEPEAPVLDVAETTTVVEQKDKLWQELFDARQEIKALYTQNQELEASISQKIAAVTQEKELLQHHLEVLVLEKQQFIENKAEAEADIKKFSSHMHEMALYQETLRQEILRLQEVQNTPKELPTHDKTYHVQQHEYEAMYRQLKAQFEDKAKVLDDARKELFSLQNELDILRKKQNENFEPTAEETHLMKELVACQDKIDALKCAHEEELVGYEEVIQGLLDQLQTKTPV